MPRAVLISVGELSLEPIKTLVERNGVTTATIAVSDTASLKNFDALTSKLSEQDLNAECLLVRASSGVENSASAFSGVTTYLVYSSPETYLTQCLIANQANENADVAIQHYIQQYRKDIQSALSALKQDSTLNLCSMDDVCANPASFLKAVFEIDSQEIKVESPTNLVYQTMALSAAAVLVDNDELYELYDDALSVGQLFGEFSVHLSPDSDTFKNNARLLNQVAIAIMQKNQQISTLNQLAKEGTAKLSEKETHCHQLVEQKTKAEEQSSVLRSELEKQKQALAEAREQLAAKEQECITQLQSLDAKTQELSAKVQEADESKAKLSEKDAQCNQLAQKLVEQRQEAELSQLQVTQLQEELDATIQKANTLAPFEQALKASNEQVLELQQKLTTANEDAQLSTLQIAQLQEELERKFSEYEAVKFKEQEATAELDKQLEVNKQLKTLQTENVHLTEHLSQLQKSLEKAELEKESLTNALSELQQTQSEHTGIDEVSNDNLQNAELELELASLQISQLQEELEYYYLALQESERSLQQGLRHATMSSNKIQTKVFDKVNASELSITGKYEEGDYQDIHLTLHNVMFPNEKQVESVKAKLVNVAGNIGIEFRAQENEALFREFEDSSDEYGPYLRYFLTAPENLQAQQQKTVERLNASERLLVMGSINVIAELLQNTNIQTSTEVTSEQWRSWRKAAIALSSHVDKLPNWLSFDSVRLREEFATDGYEHLWLVFNNVLVGNVWRNTLEFKLSANAVGMAQNGEFSDAINIEFRELSDGSAPLMTWPPETADEYGPKLNVTIKNLTPSNDFAYHDKQLILHLVNNVTSILDKLEVDEGAMSRSKSAWSSAITALLADESVKSEQQLPQESEQKAMAEVDNVLTCDEVVSVGSYQHLVFTQKGNNTKIKLRAENVNPDTFDAEVYLELRDGTSNVIYNDSEFFGEDDYGPRVKIPAETLEALILSNEQEHFGWAVSVYRDIPKNAERAENIDELIKLLWKNILNRKSEK
jgi:hypothetical protein